MKTVKGAEPPNIASRKGTPAPKLKTPYKDAAFPVKKA